ncbi:Six-hairpin glycosidase-like protein [Macrophomina phaseolina MS6]|uniref:Six-hairpin glycosidase-like protein n=1 Tax=Macrophomina phaseolina (strain MS6) TaxID=1126212 RepID=K2RS44_MACPH|nr:Six-hairpin glycosidase-like protein [Macrophomina phaseolina MS6]
MVERRIIPDNPQATFPATRFDQESFCGRKRDVVFRNTLLYQLKVLKDTGRYDAFKLRWHHSYSDEPDVPPIPNHLFWDSDVAKWIEGACYFLHERRNVEIETAVDELVDMIRSAQQPDGYLNIHFIVVEPDKRFTNLRDLHELYNAGHLIEAALAHEQLFHNGKLLDPLIKYVDLLHATLGPQPHQLHGYPGHPEIELALLRLYKTTHNPKHLELAAYFLDERGNPEGVDRRHYFDVESEKRGERFNERPHYYPQRRSYWYQQAHARIVEQQTIEGHSVRAMYLLTAAADLVKMEDGREELEQAVLRLWKNMVERKMYLTGGIGAIKQWEGFGIDYFLPQGTDEGGCYAETCASIGAMMLAERLLQISLDGCFADIMELSFYNAVLTGMSCDGRAFTYVNQLCSSGNDLSKRSEWFTCACCPPNVARLLGYLGGYFWTARVEQAENRVSVDVYMYGSATLKIPVGTSAVTVKQASDWPWDGKISFQVDAPEDIDVNLSLRIPSWASDWQVRLENIELPFLALTNPKLPRQFSGLPLSKGFVCIPGSLLKSNLNFDLKIALKPRIICPHPYTNQDIIALARGPIIYCVEDVDNPWVDDHFKVRGTFCS